MDLNFPAVDSSRRRTSSTESTPTSGSTLPSESELLQTISVGIKLVQDGRVLEAVIIPHLSIEREALVRRASSPSLANFVSVIYIQTLLKNLQSGLLHSGHTSIPAKIQEALWTPSIEIGTSQTHSAQNMLDILYGYRIIHPGALPESPYPKAKAEQSSHRYELYSVLLNDNANLALQECWGPTGLDLATHFLLLLHVPLDNHQSDSGPSLSNALYRDNQFHVQVPGPGPSSTFELTYPLETDTMAIPDGNSGMQCTIASFPNGQSVESVLDHYLAITSDMIQHAKYDRAASYKGLYTAAVNLDAMGSLFAILGLDIYKHAKISGEYVLQDSPGSMDPFEFKLTFEEILSHFGWTHATFTKRLKAIVWAQSVKANYQLQDSINIPRDAKHPKYHSHRIFLAILFLFGDDGAIKQRNVPKSHSPLLNEQAAAAAKFDWLLAKRSVFKIFLLDCCVQI